MIYPLYVTLSAKTGLFSPGIRLLLAEGVTYSIYILRADTWLAVQSGQGGVWGDVRDEL